MIGWLLVLSFVLGFVLTCVYMVRSVSRTVQPMAAAVPDHVTVGAARGASPAPEPQVRRTVEFDDDLDVYEQER